MICRWCQEAINNKECAIKGACGKDEELSSLMDEFNFKLMYFSQLELTKEDHIYLMNSIFKMITNANFNKEVFKQEIAYLDKRIGKVNINNFLLENNDLNSVKLLILTGIMGISAYHSHSEILGYTNDDLFDFTKRALGAIFQCQSLEEILPLVDECGKFGIVAMETLDKANTTTFGNPKITKVNIGVGKKPGILVSGHDLFVLKELLEQSKEANIDIYTHSEMLPAHGYPELKKYAHLYGNYGNAWWQQKEEFNTFNGPILFTTNCIVPPVRNNTYEDKVYTIHNCGHEKFTHLEKVKGKYDFTPIIEAAKNSLPPTEIESGFLINGFAHQQVADLSSTILEKINTGEIEKFVVMAGCDGRHTSRNYYTEYAKNTNNKTIILTAGCAKYRYNKLNLNDVAGIPKVLDAGQCNDSYSLVKTALTLKEALNLDSINDLPIEFNIAWYEQKAVIVLLSLLHLGVKNINLGPTLPAYLSPNIRDFIIDKYGLTNNLNI